MARFGAYIRHRREALRVDDAKFSVRKVAIRIGIEPSYLSKIERDIESAPSEPRIRDLARELGEDPDFLLALAGKVSIDLQNAICKRPRLLSQLIREVNHLPDARLRRVVRQIQRGQW
jgi:transcriptional regulator with XRE-family HTH domain